MVSGGLFAQKKTTYIGGTATGWATASNWSNGIPTSKDTIIVSKNLNAISTTVGKVVVNSGVTLSIPSGVTFNVVKDMFCMLNSRVTLLIAKGTPSYLNIRQD